MPTKTLKVRVKDKHAKLLREMSIEVNQVWNYANDLSFRMLKDHGRWLTGFDFSPYTAGASKEFAHIGSATIQEVCEEFAKKRKAAKKAQLRWRKSFGNRRSLGWVPFKARSTKFVNGQVRFAGHFFNIWDSYGLSQYAFRAGSFVEDARGRWYFCVAVAVEPKTGHEGQEIGIDLGLKDVAICSDGTRLGNARFYRNQEDRLAIAQRANKKQRAKAIHAKIANRRKDALHKFSRTLVSKSSKIVVGGVSPSWLAKTPMAKSVYDAGWAGLKIMLKYKCEHAGIVYTEVNEAYTTQICSACGALPPSRPRGIADLGIREWECVECGVQHDRDVNSAINILSLGRGHAPPVVGIPVL